jgi:hypothetical protein
MAAPAYGVANRHDRWASVLESYVDSAEKPNLFARSTLVLTLFLTGRVDQAAESVSGLIEAAEKANNPAHLAFALSSYSRVAFLTGYPAEALSSCRRALTIATESGSRWVENQVVFQLATEEMTFGETTAGLDLIARSTQDLHDSGNRAGLNLPLGLLVAYLDRVGRLEQAAVIAAALSATYIQHSLTHFEQAEEHLKAVLDEQTYDAFTRTGQAMGTAEVVAYALDQIDQDRQHPS